MRAFIMACALVSSIGSVVRAEPLDLHQVSAGATWLAHIDFDAVRNAEVAKKISDEWLRRDKAQRGLRWMRERFGIDLTTDLHSITLYGDRLVRGDGAMIVRAKVDRQQLQDFLNRMPDYRTRSHGQHTLHAWTQKKRKVDEHTVTACFYGPAVTVLGRDTDDLKTALDVLDGTSPNLAGADSLLATAAPQGTILQARATGLAAAKAPFKSPIVHQSEAIWVAIGEHEGDVFAQAKLIAKAADVANDVRAVVDGFLALAKLRHKDDQEALSALRATRVTTAEETVTVEWRGGSGHVLKLLQKAWEKRPPKWKD